MSSAGTVTRGDPRPGEAGPPRRLLLVSESAGLAAVLTRLLDRRDRLSRTDWTRETTDHGELAEADLVVLDVPPDDRAAAFQQLRRRWRGPVVVLVERGDDGRGLPADQARTLLARPFSTDDLRAALGLPERPGGGTPRRPAAARPATPPPVPAGPGAAAAGPTTGPVGPFAGAAGPGPAAVGPGAGPAVPAGPAGPGAADAPATRAGKAATLVAPPAGTGDVVSMFPPAGERRGGVVSADERRGGALAAGDARSAMADDKAAAQPAPAWPGRLPQLPRHGRLRLRPLLAELVHGWRARRAVRIFAFAALAAAAFGVAFALASQGRCGPGCDGLTGIISPASTFPEVGSTGGGPATTVRRLPPSTTTPTPGGGARGVPGGYLGSTTSTAAGQATTITTRRPTPTTRRTPPPTQPPTTPTQPPPTPTPTQPPPTPTPTLTTPGP